MCWGRLLSVSLIRVTGVSLCSAVSVGCPAGSDEIACVTHVGNVCLHGVVAE